MKRYNPDITRVGASEAPGEERADSLREPQSYGEAAAWKLVQEVRWQRDEWKAECERFQRELRAAREAVGEGWFTGGATLAQAIKRTLRFLEERLPEDPVLTCARCGPTPHRWRPSPEAGPHWRCSECGEITGPEGGAR